MLSTTMLKSDREHCILGIETSCDETGVALYCTRRGLLAHALHSQVALHSRYGGVVPELASRDHVRRLLPLLDTVLERAGASAGTIDAIAYTEGPGLAGALLVGASFAHAAAYALEVPVLGIHHLEAHLLSPLMAAPALGFPFVALLVSGGHSQLMRVSGLGDYALLGETLDDAAGEAFDKVARLLGLGFPGGPALQRLAEQGDPQAFEMPVAMARDPGLDFSFSGLKTALVYLCRDLGPEGVEERRADLAAGFQAAAVGQLTSKLKRALKRGEWQAVALGGGVAANGPLREAVAALCEEQGLRLKLVPLALCTDNAAMIASAARYAPRLEYPEYLSYDAFASSRPPLPA